MSERSLEARRARRHHRWRIGLEAQTGPAPAQLRPPAEPKGISPADLFSSPEDLLAACRQCVQQAERRLAAGDRAKTLACLEEASELFAALDDFEAAALAGGAASARRLDEVVDGCLTALDAHRL